MGIDVDVDSVGNIIVCGVALVDVVREFTLVEEDLWGERGGKK